MIQNIGRAFLGLIPLVVLTATPSIVVAQGNTFNPYGNSGYADYREFSTPMYSNNPALPGQALLNNSATVGRPRANSYQQFTNEMDGIDANLTNKARGAGSSVPYYQAYQRLNSQYNRVYQPNNTPADRKFQERQKLRDLNYAKALEEPDPLKRTKLLRQVDTESLDRKVNSTRPPASSGPTTTKPPAVSSPPPARSNNPVDRRPVAPSPFPATSVRRPTGGAPGTKPPSVDLAPSSSGVRSPSRSSAPDPSSIPVPPPR